LELKTLNPAQVENFILSDEFKTMPVIPISSHRALSHIQNPRVEAEDVILILAYEGVEMVGYLGVLADKIYNGSEEIKCGWLSCMWVNPSLRGKGIAKQLLNTAFEKWDNKILVTEFTPEAKGLYDRSNNFSDLKINLGLRCYLKSNLQELLPKKNKQLIFVTPLLKVLDSFANVTISVYQNWMSRIISKPIYVWKQNQLVDNKIEAFINSFVFNSFERRRITELNWILSIPWIQPSAPTSESIRYHFSSVDREFKNLLYTAQNETGDLKAFFFITIRSGHLKIPYAFFLEEDLNDVAAQLHQIMLSETVHQITIFHPLLVNYFSKSKRLFIHTRVQKRHYIFTKKLDELFKNKSEIIIQDGDADCAFT
jgi:GNAT superfamily N-acetyltransferase